MGFERSTGTFSLLKETARRSRNRRRAIGWIGRLSLFLDSHLAEFVRVVLGDDELRTSQGEKQKRDDCSDYVHRQLLSLMINITPNSAKRYIP